MNLIMLFIVGIAIGLIYFGGLWLTVKKLAAVRRRGFLLVISFLIRTGLALAMFLILMDGYWLNAVVLLGGFVVSRTFLIHHLGMADHDSIREAATDGN